MEISDSESSNEHTSILHQALKRKRQGVEETAKREKLNLASVSSILQAKLLPTASVSQMQTPPVTPLPMFTKHVVWATSNVTENSLFILDFKASRSLGISDLRERLSNKHPELIRYPVDEHDRDWLLQQKLISPLNKNGKYLLLVLAEVEQLAERDYKNSPYVKVSDLQGFKIPEFTYKKMQQYFNNLNERSRELMTQAKNLQNNSILSEFLFAATSSAAPTVTQSAPVLLQTSEQSTSTGETSTVMVRSTPQIKSSLSSSHATLSALLSGQGD
jgi:snurportin-1